MIFFLEFLAVNKRICFHIKYNLKNACFVYIHPCKLQTLITLAHTFSSKPLIQFPFVSDKPFTIKPVYNGQPRGITKVAFVDKWPLFGASETNYPMFTGQIKTGLCRQETTIRRCCYGHV